MCATTTPDSVVRLRHALLDQGVFTEAYDRYKLLDYKPAEKAARSVIRPWLGYCPENRGPLGAGLEECIDVVRVSYQ